MAGALRVISVQRGHDPREFALVAFGGAGPLHANAVAELMGSFPVIVPPSPGPAVRARRPRGRLPQRVRPDADPPHRARRRREEVGAHPRRARGPRAGVDGRRVDPAPSSSPSPSWPTCATTARATRSRCALERDVARARRALQRPARAALRLPHARHAVGDRQPARDRRRRAPVARAAARPSRATPTRRARSSTAARSCSRASGARRRSTTAPRCAPGHRFAGPGDRHRVRLHHRRPARLRGRGRPRVQHPDPAGGTRMSTAELRIAEIPDSSRSTRSRSTSSRTRCATRASRWTRCCSAAR